MPYRDDLEAFQLRINTLEAKLEETKASLNAREAELKECAAERDRLRQTGGEKTPRIKRRVLVIGVAAANMGAIIGFGVGLMLSSGLFGQPDLPKASKPATTYKERSSSVEGTIRVPPEPPPTPPAILSGQIDQEPAEAKTIESIIEDQRPKVRECYRTEAKAHPNAKGSVSVQFDIDASGKVTRTKLQNLPYLEPWWSKTFETCVTDVYTSVVFPNDTGTKVTAKGSYFLSALDLAF